MFIPHYTNTSSHHKQKIRTVYRFANLTLYSDRTLSNKHFGLHFQNTIDHLPGLTTRKTVSVAGTQQPTVHQSRTPSTLTVHPFLTPNNGFLWRQESPGYDCIGPNFPLLANFLYLPLPLITKLQFLCLSFSNSLLSYHMICKTKALVHMQDTSKSPCNARRKLG